MNNDVFALFVEFSLPDIIAILLDEPVLELLQTPHIAVNRVLILRGFISF